MEGERILEEDPAGPLLDLPFDQYGRYRLVADAVERLRGDSGPLRILDAGGEGILPRFLPDDLVTVGDPPGATSGPDGSPAAGSPTALPFEDGAFDYVVSVDAYARLEPASREGYLSELRRGAGKGVLLSAPFDGAAAREAQKIADDFRRAVNGGGPGTEAGPEELPGGGAPGLDAARRFFEDLGDTVAVVPNGYVPHWLAMTCLASYGAGPGGDPSGVLERVNSFYNGFVCRLDNAEPGYRHLLVASKGAVNADLGALASGGPGPERVHRDSDLSGVLFAVLPLTAELERVNVRLAEKEGALARKEIQADDLFGRLAALASAENAHKVHHNNLRRINNDLRRQRDALQQQLDKITGSRTWRLLTALRKVRLWLGRNPGSG